MRYKIMRYTIMHYMHSTFMRYGRFSNEGPAKSGLESERILSVEGVFLSEPYNFLVQVVSEVRLK